MAEKWHVGNANTDGESTRGWLLGHFIGEGDDPRASRAVEVKWGVHPADEGRDGWATDEQRTTLLILVRAASVWTCRSGRPRWRRRATTPSGVQGLTIPGRPRRTLS